MKRALLVIDVQNVYFAGKLLITHPADSFENILKTMDGANAAGIPVIVIQHTASSMAAFQKGSPQWQLHPEVAKRPCLAVIEKTLPGSFTGTGLETVLRENGVDTVVIAGYMTQMCCDTTARQAFHLGFAVEFLSDATGTLAFSNPAGSVTAEELHRVILVTQAMRFSKVMTTQQWLADL
ncbi:MAG: cysteine hydrolase family protein [Sedimentisphaerales bacterium]|jgi:nicotinamidase-related amidase